MLQLFHCGRLLEPEQGHSNARNCAIGAAEGELLIWTDDDVLVDENWLAAYAAAARDHVEAIYFGGPIDPWFEGEVPFWIERHWDRVKGVFVIRDYGSAIRRFEGKESPAGANMAFRTPG